MEIDQPHAEEEQPSFPQKSGNEKACRNSCDGYRGDPKTSFGQKNHSYPEEIEIHGACDEEQILHPRPEGFGFSGFSSQEENQNGEELQKNVEIEEVTGNKEEIPRAQKKEE